MRQQVPIVCGYAHRIGPGFRFEVGTTDIIHPEDWADREDPLYYITARYCRAIETMVRMRPEQYLWMHRRWKTRPRFEKQGKAMPKRLRQNLESLPWMDQAQLDSLLAGTAG
jgi:KDO2-lipid IV(A) lauroyltransferase